MTTEAGSGLFELMAEGGHEQLVFWSDPELGYRGLIAVHDTTLGPALGGTRFLPYGSEQAAVRDALRLARAMTYKAAVSGLNLGGGKSVIWGDGPSADREMIFRAHGRAVESLQGRYITAEDVGTSPEDMHFIAMETEYVAGLEGHAGSPSPLTAYGVSRGIAACAEKVYGDDSLAGRTVAVQGLGHVGYRLCEILTEAGASLVVADLDDERVERAVDELGAASMEPDAIYDADADVFSPCALGGVLGDDTIARLKARIVAGSANNQLADPARHGPALREHRILYAPDYVISAGGLINVYQDLVDWTPEHTQRKAGEIHDTLLRIFEVADSEGIPTDTAAARIAEARIHQARHLQRTFLP